MKKVISLLSGGFDSPMATYLMIKKNFIPIFVSFLTSDDSDKTLRKKICKIILNLSNFTKNKVKLYIIQHDINLNLFIANCERKLTCILCKRFMLRIAVQIAEMEQSKIIVTGDIIGEQASQTLDNIFAYQDILKQYILLRPLIGLNKGDIISLTQKLNFYELISSKSASCRYNPQFPETHAKFKEIEQSELTIDIQKLVSKSLSTAEILEI